MKNILIVDDEKSLILSIQAGFESYKEDFNVLTAENGKQAVSVLEETPVDLLVTDLKMPEMDGFELLAYVKTHYPTMPSIVMTAFSTPEIEKRLRKFGTMRLLEKPFDLDDLAQAVIENIEDHYKSGPLRGISLSNFLQLIEMEEKTCLLDIRSNCRKRGYLYCDRGALYSAVCGEQTGEDAVYTLLALDDVQISFRNLPQKRIKKQIDKELMSLLIEASRRKDELKEQKKYHLELNPSEKNGNISISAESGNLFMDTIIAPLPMMEGNKTVLVPEKTKGEFDMSQFISMLEKLKAVEGFQAVGIFSPEGEKIAELNPAGFDIAEFGALINDVLIRSEKAAAAMGMGNGRMVHMETASTHIIVRQMYEMDELDESPAQEPLFHTMLILKKGGNLAMGKIKMESVNKDIARILK